ncbi:MAG: hypothetical protein ACYC1U_05720 [Candidatus Aquicultorales bacterium]
MKTLSDRRTNSKRIILASVPIWAAVLAGAYYAGGLPAFWGALIGIVLVAAYFAMAVFTAGKALEKSVGLAQGLVVGGFWIRLTILGVVIYTVSFFEEISLVSTVLTFAIGYSLVLPIALAIWLPGKGAPNRRKNNK